MKQPLRWIAAAIVLIVILIAIYMIFTRNNASTDTADSEPTSVVEPTAETVAQNIEPTQNTEPTQVPPTIDANAPANSPQGLCNAATPAEEPETRDYTDTEDVLQVGVDYYAIFCTDAGAIYVDLLEDFAPLTVNNFVFLAENGFYNNTIFHRVLADFMAQGGDPTGTGRGGPGYQFRDEFAPFITFDRPGLLAMANAGAGTNGSQFFITFVPTPHLNFKHTIFGAVVSGEDNVANIMLRDPNNADAPATMLQTVIIVTDPGQVDAPTSALPESVDADVIIERLNVVVENSNMPPDLQAGFVAPEVIPTEAVPDVIADSGLVYRVATKINNAECKADYFFDSLSYTVDLLDSPQSVESLLTSDAFAAWNEENGFDIMANTIGINIYQILPAAVETVEATAESTSEADMVEATAESTSEVSAGGCSTDATTLRVYLQRGQYLITVEMVTSASDLEGAQNRTLVDLLATRIPQIFELGLDVAYRPAAQ